MQVVFVYMLTNAPPGLFKRLQALRTIINGLLRSLPAIGQALVILLLCVIVYAIIGQRLFAPLVPDKFGTFALSLYTIFGILTLDKFGDVADEASRSGEGVDSTSAFFFISLVVLCVWILIPVVVAVLLDSFAVACRAEEKSAKQEEEEARMRATGVSKMNTRR
jgi:voltage-gated sodium channel